MANGGRGSPDAGVLERAPGSYATVAAPTPLALTDEIL